MSEVTVKIDEKGRVMIPKDVREAAKLKRGSYVHIKAKGKAVIIESAEPVADKYYGAFKIAEWPEDMDEFMVEVVKKWWAGHAT
jgi:AbrB family looped-hinge helix DNA binding protein